MAQAPPKFIFTHMNQTTAPGPKNFPGQYTIFPNGSDQDYGSGCFPITPIFSSF